MTLGEPFLSSERTAGEYDFSASSAKDSLENMNPSHAVINTGYSTTFEPHTNLIVFGPRFHEKPNMEVHKHLGLEQLTLGHELRDDINRLLTANTIELHKMRMLELPVTRYTMCLIRM